MVGAVLVISKIGFSELLARNLLTNDRWSGMQSFWDFALSGKYPYASAAYNGNTNVASPGYYLLGLPFSIAPFIWAMGAAGFLLFQRFVNVTSSTANWGLLFTFCCFAIWYENVSASTIFLNAALAIIAIRYSYNAKNPIWVGLALGLILATRSVMLLPLALLLAQKIGSKQWTWKQLFTGGIIIGAVNLMFYMPFLLFYRDEFMAYNPLAEQSARFLPVWAVAILLVMAVFIGFKTTTYKKLLFGTGIVLFLTAFWHAALLAAKVGIVQSITESYTDITYFNFCLPFFIAYLAETGEGRVVISTVD